MERQRCVFNGVVGDIMGILSKRLVLILRDKPKKIGRR
jgi:hypothetical protein